MGRDRRDDLCEVNEDRAFALEEHQFRLVAIWDQRWRNLPDNASCLLCGYSHPFTLIGGTRTAFCQACLQEIWGKTRIQKHHLGRKSTPLSPIPVDANRHLLLSDMQRVWRAAGFKPGSPFAIGFDLGAYIALCEGLER